MDSFPREGRFLVSPLVVGPDHQSVGTHDPWKPKGTRAGRWTVATGGPANEVASRMTRSLASRVAPSAALTNTGSPGDRCSPGSKRVDSSRTRSYLTRPSWVGWSALSPSRVQYP